MLLKMKINRTIDPARFKRSEDGSASVEAVIWLPFLVAVFGLILDATMIFYGQTRITRAVFDTNRYLAVGYYQTVDDAETALSGILANFSDDSTVQTTVTNGIIRTDVTVPANAFSFIGMITGFDGVVLEIGAEQLAEWEV